MKTTFAVAAFVAAVYAQGMPANEYTDGQPQVPTGSAPAAYSTVAPVSSAAPVTSSVVAPVSSAAPVSSVPIVSSVAPVPYPVPAGNSSAVAGPTGTGKATLPVTKPTMATSGKPAPSEAAPSASAPAATGAAAALQIGAGAAFAGLIALFA
ncbi:uncharacterized protein LTR77_001414 [Saxophila tyrrhenica]|uniref:Uncharacterized protein n=1 Tax=Saxophila tyrrhenica TaxID=1690608 RepID=A0AAV9PPX3_9PEZI|nr:hypothetical protein LTR77_001414 [Saxophila tyrrhenica]